MHCKSLFMFCFVLFHIKSLCFFNLFFFCLHCKTTIELLRVGQLTNLVHLPSMRTVGCSNLVHVKLTLETATYTVSLIHNMSGDIPLIYVSKLPNFVEYEFLTYDHLLILRPVSDIIYIQMQNYYRYIKLRDNTCICWLCGRANYSCHDATYICRHATWLLPAARRRSVIWYESCK